MSGYNFQKDIILFCLKIIFTFTNSVDPDEMQHDAASHLDLHCLQMYSFRGSRIQRVKADWAGLNFNILSYTCTSINAKALGLIMGSRVDT